MHYYKAQQAQGKLYVYYVAPQLDKNNNIKKLIKKFK